MFTLLTPFSECARPEFGTNREEGGIPKIPHGLTAVSTRIADTAELALTTFGHDCETYADQHFVRSSVWKKFGSSGIGDASRIRDGLLAILTVVADFTESARLTVAGTAKATNSATPCHAYSRLSCCAPEPRDPNLVKVESPGRVPDAR